MPEYEPLTLEQALAHLRDGSGRVEYSAPAAREWGALLPGGVWTISGLLKTKFRLVKEEPEIVKPVVIQVPCGTERFVWQRGNQDGPLTVTTRPRAQQERLDALVEAFLARTGNWQENQRQIDITDLRDFLRVEKEWK